MLVMGLGGGLIIGRISGSSVLNWMLLQYPCRASSVLVFVVKMWPEQDRGR
jgi:hypothetical protein